MAQQGTPPGRLIAVDGSRGNDIIKAAEAVADALRARGVLCAISRWDASGLFGEMAQAAQQDRQISARTLALVYAADLAFRVRWEIRPALEAGRVVIAAPYVETAVAMSGACDLPKRWLRDLLRFVPAPRVRCRARERKVKRGWKLRLDRGYTEYCATLLEAASAKAFDSKRTRVAMVAALAGRPGRDVFDLSGDGVAAAVKAIIGSQPVSSVRSASRRRTAHS